MNGKVITVSEENKCVLWLPMKTSSTLLTIIFNHFNFETRQYDNNSNYINSTYYVAVNHKCDYTTEYDNYTLICSARNPYYRVFSTFKSLMKGSKTTLSIDEFKKFWFNQEKRIDSNFMLNEGYFFHERTPDIFIRTEFLLEDLLKIEFIRNSNYYKSGVLEELISKNINKSFINLDIKDFYDDEMKGIVYSKYKEYFKLLNYPETL